MKDTLDATDLSWVRHWGQKNFWDNILKVRFGSNVTLKFCRQKAFPKQRQTELRSWESSRRLLWSINFVLSGLKRRRFTQSTSNKFTGKHHWYQFAVYSQENVNFNVVHIELSGKQCLKTDGLKGLLQNSKRQTCFCFGFFPGGDRPPPWFFLVFTKEITSK